MSYVYSWSKPENPGAGGTKKDGTAFTIFLKQLNEGPGFANHSDWRLPTVKELLTIVDRSRSLPAIDPIFGPTQSDYYWSDDTVLEPPGHTYIAQIVNFGVLQQDPPTRPEVYTSNKVQENYVRAVRDASGTRAAVELRMMAPRLSPGAISG